jgi:SUN domain-containing protein 1/2
MEELVNRLSHLEQAVSLLSDSSRILAEAEKAGKKVDDDIMSRVQELEGSLALERKRVDNSAISGADKLRKEIDNIKQQVGALGGRVEASEQTMQQAAGKLERVDSVERDVQALRSKVDNVEQQIKRVLDDGRLREALERILPQWMPVRVKSGGLLDVDPIFWTEMRKMLVGKGEVESLVRSAMVQSSGTPKSDKDLEAWGERFIERKTGEGAVVSRSDFVRHLEGEVLNLKEMIHALPRHQPVPQPAAVNKPAKSSSVTIKTQKGDDVTSILQDLIDAALLRYSKDTIARPDYALFTAGARVIPSITSDTLVMRQPGLLGKMLMGKKPIEGRSPATALHPDISVGSCWPFAGSHGQLGVLLNRRAVISDITIEHAAADVALDTSTAPKSVEVVSPTGWGSRLTSSGL